MTFHKQQAKGFLHQLTKFLCATYEVQKRFTDEWVTAYTSFKRISRQTMSMPHVDTNDARRCTMEFQIFGDTLSVII